MSLQIKIIAVLLATIALAASFSGYGYYRYGQGVKATTDVFNASIAQQKAQASATLAAETEKTRAAEQALQTFKNNQEIKDVSNQKTVAALSARLHDLAGPTGRLRDPNQTGCGGGSSGATGDAASARGDRPANGTQAGGLLSTQLSELLQRLTREADDINDAYASCRADAYAVRANQGVLAAPR